MKLRRISGFLILALTIMIGMIIPAQKVEAGKKTTILNAASIKDISLWNCPDNDVLTDNEILEFSEKSTKNTKFISRVTIKANKENADFLVFECLLRLNQLPQGEKFVLGFGVQKIESSIGDAENIEVAFTNDGGIKVGIDAYEKKGSPIVIMEPKACGIAIGKTARIRVSISGEQVIKLSVQGKEICSKEIPVSGSGRVGFLQSGNCAAEVREINLKGYSYERPENTNVSEDFEDGVDISKIHIANTTETGVALTKPSRVVVEEYQEGEHALVFADAGGYYFTTKYMYSNFEMTFDVPFLRLEKEVFKDDGEGYFYSFGILYGLSNDANASWNSTDATDGILFNRRGNVSSSKREAFSIPIDTHKFWEDFKPFSVKLSVVDGEVTIGIKWVEEKQYTTLASYKIETGSPTGYIRFSVPEIGSVSVDNLCITNLDAKANVIDTEYKNGIVTAKDAEYEPFEKNYASEASSDKTNKVVLGTNDMGILAWYLLIPEAIVIGGAIIGLTFAQINRKKKRSKGGKNNET